MSANMSQVIRFVGSVLALAVIGIIALAVLGKDIPNVLTIIATSSLTGLVGLLAQPRNEPRP